MNLKKLLKSLKLNESTISMVLGALVIIIVGVLAINYFKNTQTGDTIPPIESENANITLPTTHEVAEGEDLWKISEKYFGTGFNWTDIAEANQLENPGQIVVGQTIMIPNVTPKLAQVTNTPQTSEITNQPTPTVSETEVLKPTGTIESTGSMEAISSDTYTVVSGDNLWNIAVRAYGDGYKWVEIAKANNLVNPNIIHSGNVFALPR